MLKDILNTFWTRIASAVIAFFVLILTTQFLGADGRGLVSLFNSIIGIIGIFSGFVGGPAIVYIVSQNKIQTLIVPIYLWAIIITIIGSAFMIFFQIIPYQYVIPVSILSLLFSIYIANYYILVGTQKVKINNFIYLFQWIVNLIVLVTFFICLQQISVWFVVLALFLSGFLAIYLTLGEIKKFFSDFHLNWEDQRTVIKSLISLCFFAQTAAIMWYLNYRLSFFILPEFSGLSAVGIYSVGVNLAEFTLLGSQSIALVAYSRISNSSDSNYAKNITIILAKVGFLLTLVITLFLIFLPPAVYSIVFGHDFSLVSDVLIVMSPGIIAYGTSIIIFNYFAGVGKNHVNAIAGFAGMVLNVLLCYLLIPNLGVKGAGITSSISIILMSFIVGFIFIKDTGLSVKEFIFRKTDFEYIYKILVRSHSRP